MSDKPVVSLSIRAVQDIAVKNLQDCVAKGTDFMPVVFIRKGRKTCGVVGMAFDNDEHKYKAFESIGMLMVKEDCHDVVIVLDAMVRFPRTKAEAEYITENWTTEQPSAYPEAMRQDCLILQNINFKGMGAVMMLPYNKNNGVVEFIDPPERSRVSERMEMRGAIRDAIMRGFIKACLIKKVTDKGLMGKAVAAMAGDKDALAECRKEVADSIKREYPNLNLKEEKHEQCVA